MKTKNYLCAILTVAGSAFASQPMLASASDLNLPGVMMQQQAVRGIVVDAHGEPIVGATVVVVGKTSSGTITDLNGRFTLPVEAGTKLQISYVGYKTVTLRASDNMQVKLEEDAGQLSEVVVVGYGTQKKANLTGAVASVDLDKSLSSRPIADVGRGLQGAVPGLNIRIPTGEVGSEPLIKIRGQVASYLGASNPLILLDNVEIPSIQMVNPDDIESISVLKDAASASIYGSKAAFGVVLITTKSGSKKDKFEVNYSNNFSWQDPVRKIEMAGIDGLRYTLDAHKNRQSPMPAGGFWRVSDESFEKILQWQEKYGGSVNWNDPVVYGRDWMFDGVNKYGYRIYDGVKAMVRSWAPTQTHNLSFSGKSGKTSYNIGLGYLDQNGMSKAAKIDDFKRYNASISINSEINKYLSIRASSIYSDRNKRYPGVGTTIADPWLYLYRWSALMPIGVTENGHNLREAAYEMGAANTDNLENKYYNVNLGLTLNFTKNWNFKFDYTYDNQFSETNASVVQCEAGLTWYGPTPLSIDGQPVFVDEDGNVSPEGTMRAYTFPYQKYYPVGNNSYIKSQNSTTNRHTFNSYTTYNLRFGANKEHAFKFMAGMNSVASKSKWLQGKKNDLIDIHNPQFPLATGDQFASGSNSWSGLLGFFGRINYNYADRYLLEGNIRRDGSSKFPSHLRWEWFPSFSAGWVFSNEAFMESISKVFSFGKLRASWGSIGDQTVSNTLYRSTLGAGVSNWLGIENHKRNSFGTPTLIDKDISWQRIETLDFGLDLRFFKNELGITFDWYQRYTKDMIIPGESLSVTLGTGAPRGNYGDLRTRGWELSLDYRHRFANGLGINMTAMVFDSYTDITKGADHLIAWENRSIWNDFSTGRRYGDIYGLVTDRLFQKDDFVYDDAGNLVKTNVIYKGTIRKTNKQTSKYPVYQVQYENGDKLMFAPGDVKFVDLDHDGYITTGASTNGDHGDLTVIGNSRPRYEYSFRLGLDYKGFDFSIFCQGIAKRKIWGSGQLAIPGFNAKEGAMPKTFATEYWTPERTDAFYPRAWDLGNSNSGFGMQVQSKYLLNMAYLRIKNINMGYSLPKNLLSKLYLTKARVYVSLENFFTFDKLRGLPIDPEAISGYSMFSSSYNLSRTGTGTPLFKSVSCGIQLSF